MSTKTVSPVGTGNTSPSAPGAFLRRHPVFTVAELDAFLARRSDAGHSPESRQSLLSYHRGRGRVLPIRRGLWATVPEGHDPESYPVDTFLVASRLAPDAVLAYHTALLLHGAAHSLREERTVLSSQPLVRPLTFQGVTYRTVRPPAALPPAERLSLGVETADRQGLTVRVTTPERTLVDVLDRPALAGGWEEAWRSLEGFADTYLDLEFVARYALLLGNATTVARVGYFLEANRDRLGARESVLEALRAHAPRQPQYSERDRRSDARLVRGWNLLVPSTLLSGETGGEALA